MALHERVNIILEGCDKVGKTTIANELLALHPGFRKIHTTAPQNEEEGQMQCNALVTQMNENKGLLFDRALLGECVYAPIKRGYAVSYMRELETKLLDHSYIFLIQASQSTVMRRFDDVFLFREEILPVLNAYAREFLKSNYKRKWSIYTDHTSPFECAMTIATICKGAVIKC